MFFSSSRAQDLFRRAMRSPFILFHIVPAAKRLQYEQFSKSELRHNPGPGPGLSSKRLSLTTPGVTTSRPTSESKLGQRNSVAGDYNVRRMSKSGPHPNLNQQSSSSHFDQSYTLSAPSITPPSNNNPPVAFSKKIGRRFDVELSKGKHNTSG